MAKKVKVGSYTRVTRISAKTVKVTKVKGYTRAKPKKK